MCSKSVKRTTFLTIFYTARAKIKNNYYFIFYYIGTFTTQITRSKQAGLNQHITQAAIQSNESMEQTTNSTFHTMNFTPNPLENNARTYGCIHRLEWPVCKAYRPMQSVKTTSVGYGMVTGYLCVGNLIPQ